MRTGSITFIDVLDMERTLQQNQLVARRQHHRGQHRSGAVCTGPSAAAGTGKSDERPLEMRQIRVRYAQPLMCP